MSDKKLIKGHPFVSYSKTTFEADESKQRAIQFHNWLNERRSVRDFSDKPVSKAVIENIILSASTAPSGAHKQPWTFCVVSNPEMKAKIREAAEEEERISYGGRMSEEWLKDLEPIGTDWEKPFLEIAPYLIIVFKRSYELGEDGTKHKNYYVQESVGLACGFLLTAIHDAGLVALTHTPSPMNFLTELLERPSNEKPFLLIPVGYPVAECWVPDIERKNLGQVAVWYD
jgi:nitroreductase